MSPSFLIGGDLPVHRLGFGAMRLCGQPGNFGPYPDWQAGMGLLRHAAELGVQLFDTAHPYGPGFNEELIADALSPYSETLVITTKGGVEKTAPDRVFPDGKPESLRKFCEASLRRLRLERIDLYQLHKPDPNVPLEESVGTLAQLQLEGKIRHIGLSNVSLDQLRVARAIVPIASVQNRYNLLERGDDPVLDFCTAHGIAYLPWGPLAAKPFEPGAPIASGPAALQSVAAQLSATPSQVALAWLLRRAPNILPIPGTTSRIHLEENLAAAQITLSEDQFVSAAAPAAILP
jgi:aryl-alcohol dehydrogenase-like predicted oxidoreductase